MDAVARYQDEPPVVFRDIPFDAARDEVVLAPRLALLRAAPSHQYRVRLLAVDERGERVIGDYTFHHAPFVS